MRVLLSVCAYCERDEAVNPLRYTDVAGRMVILCDECRAARPALSAIEVAERLTAPVDLLPGLSAVDHYCPMLEYDGFNDDAAVIRLELQPEGDYRRVQCPECGLVIRSSAAPAAPGKT